MIRISIQDLCRTRVEAMVVAHLPQLRMEQVWRRNSEECKRSDCAGELDEKQSDEEAEALPATLINDLAEQRHAASSSRLLDEVT